MQEIIQKIDTWQQYVQNTINKLPSNKKRNILNDNDNDADDIEQKYNQNNNIDINNYNDNNINKKNKRKRTLSGMFHMIMLFFYIFLCILYL